MLEAIDESQAHHLEATWAALNEIQEAATFAAAAAELWEALEDSAETPAVEDWEEDEGDWSVDIYEPVIETNGIPPSEFESEEEFQAYRESLEDDPWEDEDLEGYWDEEDFEPEFEEEWEEE